ncbi:cytochrome c oxidase accessory protein CcoG [compost metagenome]
MCVQVCPTGIDIRDGLQIECIGCAACIDACDSIMDKMGYPRGLISYTTEHNLSGQKTHLVRPRLIGYAIALTAMIGLLVTAIVLRPLVGFDVSKDRVLYRENAEGRIENVYSLKIMNKDQQDHTYVLGAKGLDGLRLEGKQEVKIGAGDILSMPVELSIDPEKLPSTTNEITFTIQSVDNPDISKEASSRFIGPRLR